MRKLVAVSQLLALASLIGLGFSSAARADEPGLEVHKDRLRAATKSVLKESEEFYDACLEKGNAGDKLVNEKAVKLLVALRQFKHRIHKFSSISEARETFLGLQNLLEDLRLTLEHSFLYSDSKVSKRWSDLLEQWSYLRSIAL